MNMNQYPGGQFNSSGSLPGAVVDYNGYTFSPQNTGEDLSHLGLIFLQPSFQLRFANGNAAFVAGDNIFANAGIKFKRYESN